MPVQTMDDGTEKDKEMPEANTNQNCSDAKTNGHISPVESLKNGLDSETSSNSDTPCVVQNGGAGSSITFSSVPAINHESASPEVDPSTPNCNSHQHNHEQGSSPSRISPNTPQQLSRGESPHDPQINSSSPPNHQHVVHVHVNPGETFSVRVGDQIQHIQGPATVRMVSNNGPPLPMPMQVPPGHMVQQIVDEHGILTHVILSPNPPGMPNQPMTGPNNTAPQYYPYGPHYPTPPYPPHHHPTQHPSHIHPSGPTHGTPPPPPPPPPQNSCNSHPSGPVHSQGPTRPNSMEGRASRQREKIQRKYLQRLEEGHYQNQNRPPPRSRVNKQKGMNGDIHSNSTPCPAAPDTGQIQELEEERKILQQQLSNMPEPAVSEVESRSALIQLAPPEYDQSEFEIDPGEFRYELLLSDKGKEGKYKLVYSGDATEITLKDLKPATDYFLRVCTSLEDLKGKPTKAVQFTTGTCEPDAPVPPKLSSKTKTSITLKWNATCENGSKVTTYMLDYDKGLGDGFVEVYNGLQRQHRVSKLQASTKYMFRVAAINNVGKSQYSEPVAFYTSGSVPNQPDPPMLSEAFVNSLLISWIKRPNEDSFLLQMEDELTGHGFIPVYNGTNLSYKIKNLRRNTDYKYRLAAINDEGQSKWSEAVSYKTLPDRPSAPPKPQIKGKIHAHSFKVVWESPKDNGGSEITKYIVELNDGKGYEMLYEGSEREHICDHLIPGHAYQVRVACCSAGGRSEFSDPCITTTQAVPPGQCQAPKLQGKPKATSLHLRWSYPEYDGGASITEFAAQLISPDNTSREVYKGRDLDCIVAGLSPGRPYLFQVRAINRVGGGPWSEPLEVVSGAGVPDPPKAPMVICRSPHSAMVNWEAPVNNGATITEYRVEWQHKSDLDFMQLYLGPNLGHEVKGLTAASLYSFRVQAINSAGAGPFSPVATTVTPPSSPSPVIHIRSSATATTIYLTWKEPNCNGSDIIGYNLDIGEKQLISIGAITEYTIEELAPETSYKIRVQAVNGIGVGAFSSPVKVTTRPLPPNPSRLECVSYAPNSLKLKWGDGRNLDLLTYTLEMEKEDGNFQMVYQGTSNSYKINKLQEMTSYDLRLFASNAAGSGPYSEVYTFTTLKAPPPALKAPKVQDVQLHSCFVEWQGCKPVGSDTISYILQLYCRDQDFRQVYCGPESQFFLTNLNPKTDYMLRVCAIRHCSDGSGDVIGAFSPSHTFMTQGHEPISSSDTRVSETKFVEPKQLTDQQCAVIILCAFVFLAILVAILLQQIISWSSGHSNRDEDIL